MQSPASKSAHLWNRQCRSVAALSQRHAPGQCPHSKRTRTSLRTRCRGGCIHGIPCRYRGQTPPKPLPEDFAKKSNKICIFQKIVVSLQRHSDMYLVVNFVDWNTIKLLKINDIRNFFVSYFLFKEHLINSANGLIVECYITDFLYFCSGLR